MTRPRHQHIMINSRNKGELFQERSPIEIDKALKQWKEEFTRKRRHAEDMMDMKNEDEI